MGPEAELIRHLDREEINAARQLSLVEKLREGPRLFDRSCRLMLVGLRAECPDCTESDLLKLLEERLDLISRLEMTSVQR